MSNRENAMSAGRWGWVPEVMPRIAEMVSDKRVEMGAAHVAKCWRDGMSGVPDRFFAVENAVALGTPPTDHDFCALALSCPPGSGRAFLFIAKPEQAAS